VVIGALTIILGLSLFQALTTILVGSLLGSLFIGLGSILGSRTHTATIVNTRAVFGIKGNIPAEALNWITIVGWAVVNSVLAALAPDHAVRRVGMARQPARDRRRRHGDRGPSRDHPGRASRGGSINEADTS
jgi:nucleobase:cation symporter-1, NCS1 family